MFDKNQLFIVFEFGDGGKALESCQFQNIFQAKSVLSQVAFSLAVAEEAMEFEHRDLHWGNILVKKTNKKQVVYTLMGRDIAVDTHTVDVCLIDFTLSRLKKGMYNFSIYLIPKISAFKRKALILGKAKESLIL